MIKIRKIKLLLSIYTVFVVFGFLLIQSNLYSPEVYNVDAQDGACNLCFNEWSCAPDDHVRWNEGYRLGCLDANGERNDKLDVDPSTGVIQEGNRGVGGLDEGQNVNGGTNNNSQGGINYGGTTVNPWNMTYGDGDDNTKIGAGLYICTGDRNYQTLGCQDSDEYYRADTPTSTLFAAYDAKVNQIKQTACGAVQMDYRCTGGENTSYDASGNVTCFKSYVDTSGCGRTPTVSTPPIQQSNPPVGDSSTPYTPPTTPNTPGIDVVKTTIGNNNYLVGQVVRFRIEITNTGNTNLSNVNFVDNYFTSRLDFLTATGYKQGQASKSLVGLSGVQIDESTGSIVINNLASNNVFGVLTPGQKYFIEMSFITLSQTDNYCAVNANNTCNVVRVSTGNLTDNSSACICTSNISTDV